MALDTSRLITELQPLLAGLREDLLARSKHRAIRAGLELAFRKEQAAQRTADTFEIWCRGRATQVAAAWVLSLIFVRTLEDRGLIERRRIAGPGAEDSEEQFVSIAPFLTARDYLLTVFRELGRLPGVEGIFDARHNPVWVLAPSGDGARKLLDFFRQKDESGALRFSFEGTDTRFLGDLYQDLDAEVRSRYALLQTPDFVESFILDGALTPAIKTFGLKEVKLIDPTCGSGHFLLGAFRRLFEAWRQAEPSVEPHVHALRAMGQVFGADLNPYAVAIARFRLTLAFLEVTGITRLEKAPPLAINVCVADSLLYGTAQTLFSDRPGAGGRAVWGDDLFALEDEGEALRILGGRYQAVVGNPPYINVKDEALREAYRHYYKSCHRGYQLVAPFVERFFGLAIEDGCVGAIVGNGFMKREFGKKLIEEVLPRFNLTSVVDTSGAYIPGHGTPTAILFGTRQRPPQRPVLAVMGKRGEPATPENPATGQVWSSICDHHRDIGFENEYVSVAEVERERFAKHPWSLGGGGAAELKALLEERAERRLGETTVSIGRGAHTGNDEAYVAPQGALQRRRIQSAFIKHFVEGDKLRDWSLAEPTSALFPYGSDLRAEIGGAEAPELRWMWPYRDMLWERREPNGTHREIGLTWFEYSRFHPERFIGRCIAFAFVATHNHFVLDCGGKVFKQSAPIIKLPEAATEEDHLGLLGYLNSSTACYWMKQVCFPKSNASQKHHPDPVRQAFEFAGTALLPLPIPHLCTLAPIAAELDRLGGQRMRVVADLRVDAHGIGAAQLWTALGNRWREADELRERMVALQEEIDWRTYGLFRLEDSVPLLKAEDLDGVRVRRGDRPFEREHGRALLVRRGGEALTLHEAEVESGDPVPLPPRVAAVWLERQAMLRNSPLVAAIENARFKRLWRDSELNEPESAYRERVDKELLVRFVLSLLEGALEGKRAPCTVRALAHTMQQDPRLLPVAEVLTNDSSPDLERLLTDLVGADAVPHAAALRYTDTGLEKRAAWERTWDLQRREDAGEKLEVPVPPKYDSKDFRDQVYWHHRGKLDVPKERFISYPGAESDDDPSSLVGWAGWDHLQQATALAALYQKRKDEDGWQADRLTPLLAGLLELVPWLKQWHNEPDAKFGGLRQGDFFETFVLGETRRLGLTADDLRAWRPIRAAGRRRGPAGNGAPRATRTPRAAHTADDLLQAMAALDTGEGVEQRALAEHLGIAGTKVAKLAADLIAEGRLVDVSRRPRRFALPERQKVEA